MREEEEEEETSVSVGSEMEKRERDGSSTLIGEHTGDPPDIPCREVSLNILAS